MRLIELCDNFDNSSLWCTSLETTNRKSYYKLLRATEFDILWHLEYNTYIKSLKVSDFRTNIYEFTQNYEFVFNCMQMYALESKQTKIN